jgi:lipid-A-disaccharide synthase
LANLVLGEGVAPELIQHQATPDRMLTELEKLCNDDDRYRTMRVRLNDVPELLGGAGASQRAAAMIIRTAEELGAL